MEAPLHDTALPERETASADKACYKQDMSPRRQGSQVMHDLVIRGGTVVDGKGGKPYEADVAVDGGMIAYVGPDAGPGKEEIDAKGLLVTPGFVDLHTHYDAQVMWDPILAPSAWHGVTTVVMGNCAVGFAPARAADRPWLFKVMEAVEEIPQEVMEAGITWDWETYPEYLDALERRKHTIDIGTQIAHVAVRAYVMGERADRAEPATDADIAAMSEVIEEGLRAGALAWSCSRTDAHRLADGRIVPGAYPEADEVLKLSESLGRVGNRVMQYLGNYKDMDRDLAVTTELARRSGSPIHFIMSDTGWRKRIATIEDAQAEGLTLFGHVAPRAVGMIMHWRAVGHMFAKCPTMQAIEDLPWAAKVERLRNPAVRASIISEYEPTPNTRFRFDRMYEMADYPDYEPDPKVDSIEARAASSGRDPVAYVYDVLMRNEAQGMLYVPFSNYTAGDFSEVRQLLLHPRTVLSLSDGGAHNTRICDSASPTFMLDHWARGRTRGETLPLEHVVKSLTLDTASSYGLNDRGVVAPGYLADLNVIDFDKVRVPAPYTAFDFPAGGQRLLQKAEGYVATIKRGQVTFRHGEHCGVFPGAVIRGPQAAPSEGAPAQVRAAEPA